MKDSPTYLLTGATGLVGSYIARALLEKDCRVQAITRQQGHYGLLTDVADRIEWLTGSLEDPFFLDDTIVQADYVVHAAAMVSFSSRKRRQMLHTNVELTARLVDTMLAFPVKKCCFISSVGTIGRPPGQQRLDESCRWEDSTENSDYALSKFLAEKEIWRGTEEGLPAVIVNPSVVLGRGPWSQSSLQLFAYGSQNPTFYPTGLLNYVDARDVAQAVVNALDGEVLNQRFILSAGSVSYQQVLEQIAKLTGGRPPMRALSPAIGQLVCWAEKTRSLLSAQEPRITPALLRSASNRYEFSNQKALGLLPNGFRSLEETLGWCLQA